jgi:hypothetical protein
MDESLYGKEIAKYKLDYLGGHENIDAVLMHPDITIYKKGIVISSSLHKNQIYLRWDEIEYVVYYRESPEKIKIEYMEEKTITLEKADESVDIADMLLKVKSVSPDTEILIKVEILEDPISKPEEAFFTLEEQGLRIYSLLGIIGEEDLLVANEKWENYLINTLKFPFQAKINEYQEKGPLQEGDELTVLSIDGTDDVYGILVNIAKKKKRYVFPLCDLEVVDEKSENYLPVSDYSYWYANY